MHTEFGDVVLADRGFNIHDDLPVRGAKLEIPAFTKGKSQLSRAEVETSRRLAHVRIHVERISLGNYERSTRLFNICYQ